MSNSTLSAAPRKTVHQLLDDCLACRTAMDAHRAGRPAAAAWPAWTDEFRWGLGPDAGDESDFELGPDAPDDTTDDATWELGPAPDDDQWHADQTPDSEGLTETEAGRFELAVGTDGALDWLLDSIDDQAEESMAMDRYENGIA